MSPTMCEPITSGVSGSSADAGAPLRHPPRATPRHGLPPLRPEQPVLPSNRVRVAARGEHLREESHLLARWRRGIDEPPQRNRDGHLGLPRRARLRRREAQHRFQPGILGSQPPDLGPQGGQFILHHRDGTRPTVGCSSGAGFASSPAPNLVGVHRKNGYGPPPCGEDAPAGALKPLVTCTLSRHPRGGAPDCASSDAILDACGPRSPSTTPCWSEPWS